MELTPDRIVVWSVGSVAINATVVGTWVVMALLALVSWLATRRLAGTLSRSRGQNMLEVAVQLIREQITSVAGPQADSLLPFIGTLYLLIAAANFLSIVPGYHPPTGSLSTTAALALCVFMAVPVYGIAHSGPREYLARYVRPTPLMLPFNILSELSRTVALAVRLFGNVMSGTLIIAILLSVAPLLFPVVMRALELLIGQVQAYIFAILATVYVASAAQNQRAQNGGNRPRGGRSAAEGNRKEKDNHG